MFPFASPTHHGLLQFGPRPLGSRCTEVCKSSVSRQISFPLSKLGERCWRRRLVGDAGGPAAAGNATTPGNTVPEEAERRFPSFRLLPLPALVPSCVALCSRIKSQHFAPRVRPRPRPRCVHLK